jgi:transposase
MPSFPAAIKVYLCTVACHMRRSFDGLSRMAEPMIRCNPFAGHLLVFCNRRGDRLKIPYWDRDGWAIWYKRLEAGTFQFPFAQTGRQEVAAWELGMLLEGIDPRQVRRRKRYRLPAAAMGAEDRASQRDLGMTPTRIQRRIEQLQRRLAAEGGQLQALPGTGQ